MMKTRSLGEVLEEVGALGFVRIHHNHAVNPGHVREIRPAGSGWEVRLEPPVNKVLSVSRRSLQALLDAYLPSGKDGSARSRQLA